MKIGLAQLVDEGSIAHVEESRAFNAAAAASAADRPKPDLSTPEGLELARSSLTDRPTDPRAVPRIVRAGGREVRVFRESTHGFTSLPTAMARSALNGIESWLAGRLAEIQLRTPPIPDGLASAPLGHPGFVHAVDRPGSGLST